jgi:3-oxoadipate enol-lactonase
VKRAAGINYAARGQGSIPVICLHGIGGDTSSFQPQLDGLKGHIIAWNMPGYGGSDPLPDLTFPALAIKLREFLEVLGFKHVHLCGQSIGGMLALEMAFSFPDYVASLALIGTTAAFGGRDDAFKDKFIAARLGPLDAGRKISELAREFVPEIVGPIATEETLATATKSMAAVPDETYRAIIRCLVTFNRRADIETLRIPTCLIAGEHDQNAPARTMARMADKISGSQYHEIAGAGHLINLEAGGQTNAILNNFYDNQRGPT